MRGRTPIARRLGRLAAAAAALLASPSHAEDGQTPEDRSDALIVAEEVEEAAAPEAPPSEAPAAQADQGGVASMAQTLIAGAIRVEGASALPPSAFAPAIEPYLGRALAPAELRSLARDVAEVARQAGYGLATAWVPAQQVTNGVLRVRLDEGRIDAIDAQGPAGEAVAQRLAALADGSPVRTDELERRLLIAGDLAGVSVGRVRLERQGERNVLRVQTWLDRVEGWATLDNWGSDAIGPLKSRVVADINRVAMTGDSLRLGGAITPLQPREFQLLEGGYSVPLGTAGTAFSVSGYASWSAAGAELRDRDLEGTGREAELTLSHPLLRSRKASLWAYLDLGLRDSELTRENLLVRDDRIATLSGALYGWARAGGGVLRVRAWVAQGLDAFGATVRADPLASREDASGVFTKLAFWVDFTRPLGSGFSVQLSGQGQFASRPLLASEEMGLGGRSYLRGYDYREFAGDRGAAGAIELRFDLNDLPRQLGRLQLYAYADAGRVTNLRDGFGSGALASAGGGVRLRLPHRIEAGLELGVPLRDGFDGTRPSPRLSLTLAKRF